MSELVEFLTAILDEHEEVAQREHEHSGHRWDMVAGDADSLLVQMMSPAAVLADIASKRRLINLAREWQAMAQADPVTWGYWRHADVVLRLLATAYAHRPGYLAEWAPR